MKRTLFLLGLTAFLLSFTWTHIQGQKAEIRSFYAIADQTQGTVALTWWSSGDDTFISQIIEFSPDGRTFSPIAEIPVTGLQGGQYYRYIHATPVAGVNSYRIVLMFKNGRYMYSEAVKAYLQTRPVITSYTKSR